MITEHRL